MSSTRSSNEHLLGGGLPSEGGKDSAPVEVEQTKTHLDIGRLSTEVLVNPEGQVYFRNAGPMATETTDLASTNGTETVDDYPPQGLRLEN